MAYENEEIQSLVEQRQELIRKLDTFSYETDIDKESDELRCEELEKQIRQLSLSAIKQQSSELKTAVSSNKIQTVQDLRRLHKQKYDRYCDLAKEAFNFYKELVKEKETGRIIGEELKGHARTVEISSDNNLKKTRKKVLTWTR